ncbi:hypothetical protein [Streptomyces pseudovenezuelae]|uniref:hypothetical protein n=1 Tax=Streptomyces pseudovenezuelae TaxID=67350 RepID=UPI0036E6E1CB
MSEFHDDARAQDWLTHTFRILSMDALWTRWLNKDRKPSDGDVMQEAADYGAALQSAWLHLTNDETLNQIEQYLSQRSVRVWRETMRHGLDDAPSNHKQLAEQVHGACKALRTLRRHEFDELQQQVDALRAGARASGDLSERATCFLLFLSPLVALALGQPLIAGAMWTWFLATKCRNVVLGLSEGGG